MVDREARRKYAELVRQFISGRMTNEDYEKRFNEINLHQDDRAVNKVYGQVWFLYNDIRTHRLTGQHRLDRAGRREIARAVLFLQSDNEYVWPRDAVLMLWGCLAFFVFPWAVLCLLGLFSDQPTRILQASVVIGPLLVSIYAYLRWQTKRRWNKTGDADAWPFQHHADLQEAARHPRLLNGGH